MQAVHADYVIIGAGIAGLAAARQLQAAGRPVLVLDKGRRTGGRCASRRADGYVFDHGAQYIRAHGPDFAGFCEAAQQAGVLASWHLPDGKPVLSGRAMMRDLPVWMGRGLDIRQNVTITLIERRNRTYYLYEGEQIVASAHYLVVTPPAPQSAALLDGLDDQLAATARSADYDPCWTVMLGFAGMGQPEQGVIQSGKSQSGKSQSGNSQSGKFGMGWARWHSSGNLESGYRASLVLQAGPAWSRAHLEQPAEEIADRLWQEFTAGQPGRIAHAKADYCKAHRWRYARVASAVDRQARRLSDDRSIVLAGDWLGGPRIEAAWQSGMMAADLLLGSG